MIPIQPPRYCIARPWVPPGAIEEVVNTLNSRWIGQGPKVDRFEKEFERKFGVESAVAVNSGTAALELAYELIGIGAGDEVITTPLTCTATNIPLLRRGAKIVFADIRRDTLTIDKEDVNRRITARTKAIVMVNLNGIDSQPEEFFGRDSSGGRIPVVVDSSQALGNFGGTTPPAPSRPSNTSPPETEECWWPEPGTRARGQAVEVVWNRPGTQDQEQLAALQTARDPV